MVEVVGAVSNELSGVGSTSVATGSGSATDDLDLFLNLLVSQLENQDPTDPMSTNEYVALLASYSEVEQAVSTNAKLDALTASSTLDVAAGLVGRTVTSTIDDRSGVVSSVVVSGGDLTAITEAGERISLTSGVEIS